jgi:F-box/TPR repeat protein Pof3
MKSLNLSNTPVETLPFFPATLEHINLSRMRHLNVQPAREDETYELPCLESFDCSGTAISHRLVKAMTLQSIKSGKLKKLCLGDRLTEFLPGTPVEDEYPPSTSVRELSLASLLIREGRILEIIKLYPNLERLDVSGTKITGVAVKQLVQMGIKWLNLNECGEVSPDAVEYARGKGIDVQFNFPSRGGRMASFRNASFI